MAEDIKNTQDHPENPTPAVFPELPAPSDDDVMSMEEFVKVRKWMDEQVANLGESCKDLSDQLKALSDRVEAGDHALGQRMERLATLLTHHMSYFRQLVELVDSYGDKLTETENSLAKRDLKIESIITRQNRFSEALGNMQKNFKQIVDEVEALSSKYDSHDITMKHWVAVVAVAGTVIAWLMAGDNIIDVLHYIGEMWGK